MNCLRRVSLKLALYGDGMEGGTTGLGKKGNQHCQTSLGYSYFFVFLM